MSKYSPLTDHLSKNGSSFVPMRFSEIERVIGRALPPSSREHRAWWSNNPSNNVMTKAWLAAGYETEQVDISDERLVFRRRRNATPNAPSSRASSDSQSVYGCMEGVFTFEPGFDPAEPAGEKWDVETGGPTR